MASGVVLFGFSHVHKTIITGKGDLISLWVSVGFNSLFLKEKERSHSRLKSFLETLNRKEIKAKWKFNSFILISTDKLLRRFSLCQFPNYICTKGQEELGGSFIPRYALIIDLQVVFSSDIGQKS